ncbi:hypothetical protein ACFQ0K_18380 [Nocardioides caeni]|uniref:hypothetical protein n=1 Tax=Nocardioides caeni TaxID=574700 RepID=UPI0031EB5D3F
MSQESRPRRRHLMDPNAPRQAPDPEAVARLQRVQRRIMSALLVTTVLHLSVGLVIAADHVGDDRLDAQIGLCVIAGAFMTGGVVTTLLVLGRSWRSPWLIVGCLPTVVGLWWVLR